MTPFIRKPICFFCQLWIDDQKAKLKISEYGIGICGTDENLTDEDGLLWFFMQAFVFRWVFQCFPLDPKPWNMKVLHPENMGCNL